MNKSKLKNGNADEKASGVRLPDGRMPCPVCGVTVTVPMASLLGGLAIFCGGCGVKLSIDMNASRNALSAIRKTQNTLGDIDKTHQPAAGYDATINKRLS